MNSPPSRSDPSQKDRTLTGLRSDTRGQTLNDYAIAMTIFFLVLGYIVMFVPSLIVPFSPSTDSTSIRVDRTADFYVHQGFADEGSPPNTLNATCTKAFFAGNTPSGCYFTTTDPGAAAGLPSNTNVNMTFTRDGKVANIDGVQLAKGPNPLKQGSGNIIRAVRIVTIDDRVYTFTVRIW